MRSELPWDAWPPREYLLKSLVEAIPAMADSYHPETGQFGTTPWICNDQNLLFPLAVAWATEDAANPFHQDEQLLQMIARGGEALVDAQDRDGAWIFRKKDNSTWGQVHQPWTYSRWVRAYRLVRDALPAASRRTWETGLQRGFGVICERADLRRVGNMTGHNMMALYIASLCFQNEAWRAAAVEYLLAVVEDQEMGGYWSEHLGPVIGYNLVYLDILGIYYAYSRDDRVLEALTRAARFHCDALFPDGSSLSAIEERTIYHGRITMGNVGFSWTPEGRGFLLRQVGAYSQGGGRLVEGDYAAHMLLHSGEGSGIDQRIGDNHTVVFSTTSGVSKRVRPWQWVFSGYACPPPRVRWVQDRQSLIDVFHDELGLVAGGGNTKLQPLWSTFTVGDASLLSHTPGDDEPEFNPDVALQWTPDSAVVDVDGDVVRMSLKYGGLDLQRGHGPYRVRGDVDDDGAMRLRFEAPVGVGAEAHLPLLNRGDRLVTASGEEVALTEGTFRLTAEELGGFFVYQGLRVEVPDGGWVTWPAMQHDPYRKDGSSTIDTAKLVICLPFDEAEAYTVALCRVEQIAD